MNARETAFSVLRAALVDGAFATPTLDVALAQGRLPVRDRALATTLVYGTLRAVHTLDVALEGLVNRPVQQLDVPVRVALWLGLYQLWGLTRVPAHAAVSESVTLARRYGHVGGARLVNAVLRRASQQTPPAGLGDVLSLPTWLRAELLGALGATRMEAFCAGRRMPPVLSLRLLGDMADRAAVVDAFAAGTPDAEVTPSPLVVRSVRTRALGNVRVLPTFLQMPMQLQEEGSQLAADAAGVRPGERVLEVCAGHGSKTVLFAQAAGPLGEVVAVDRKQGTRDAVLGALAHAGAAVAPTRVHTGDARLLDETWHGQFDRVIVDAPCSGAGTLHRRPEIALRLRPEDIARLAILQREILQAAASCVRPGGALVFMVCSPLSGEQPVLSAAEWSPIHTPLALGDGRFWPVDDDGGLRIGPWMDSSGDGPDVFQVWRWNRA